MSSGLLGRALAFALLLAAYPAAGEEAARVALVVGSGAYKSLPALPNADADARLLSGRLREVGFEVETLLDTSHEAMRRGLERFAGTARGAEVALIYFAGHGVQIEGVNFLLPVDAEVRSRADLAGKALTLQDMLTALERAGADLGVVVLDACRDNPLAAVSGTRSLLPGAGLARTAAQRGMLIAFAAAPGQVALDGARGTNSPFAAAFAHFLEEPGLEVGLLFRKVSERVREMTGGVQVPWTEAALTGSSVYLHPPLPTPPDDPVSLLNAAIAMPEPAAREVALAEFLADHPASPLAPVAHQLLRDLARARTDAKVAATDDLEDEAAHWQRVLQLAGTGAEALALDAFLTLHEDGEFAARARARRGALLPSSTPPPPDAAELLWPLVDLAGRPELLTAFADAFPGTELKDRARVQLAALETSAPAALPVTSDRDAGRAATVEVTVGTGPATVPLPARAARVTVLAPPRHGSLVVPKEAGRELVVGKGDTVAAPLRYRPAPEARDVVDEIVLEVGEPAVRHEVSLVLKVDPCDLRAGTRFDRQGVVAGLYRNEVDTAQALPACQSAVKRFPEVARFRFELGRALDLAGRPGEALQHYQAARAAGHATAINSLAALHEEGRGVALDLEQARVLYLEAADRGDSYAMNNLGRIHRDGLGVPVDREAAVGWFRRAAAHGNTFAYNNLGWLLLEEGDASEALVLFEGAADAGDIYGYNNLGWMYERGLGVEPDLRQAIGWYEKAAAGGQPHAPINLGLIYRDGRQGVPADPAQAARWFAEAARTGSAWGRVHLAKLYAAGAIGGRVDPETAARLLARAWRLDAGEARTAAGRAFATLPEGATVAALQKGLARRGLDPGPLDGHRGPRTQAAIAMLARREGPPLTADAPTVELLGRVLTTDQPANKSVD